MHRVKPHDWQVYLHDGLHLSKEGNELLFNLLKKLIEVCAHHRSIAKMIVEATQQYTATQAPIVWRNGSPLVRSEYEQPIRVNQTLEYLLLN